MVVQTSIVAFPNSVVKCNLDSKASLRLGTHAFNNTSQAVSIHIGMKACT